MISCSNCYLCNTPTWIVHCGVSFRGNGSFRPCRKTSTSMKKKKYVLLIAFILLPSLSWGGSTIDAVMAHYRSLLIPRKGEGDTIMAGLRQIQHEKIVSDQMIQELMNRYPFDMAAIRQYCAKINHDGSFADIDYHDTKRSGWQPKQHAERLLELCKLYASPTTSYYHSTELLNQIHLLMDYWFKTKPVCKNWWYNQIGIPKTLGQAFIIIEDRLSPQQKTEAVKVMEQAQFGMTGQNKVWLASNVLIRALLTNDDSLMKAARDTIVSEIRNDGEEGIRPDWSYQLHGPQQQFGNYGLAFLTSMVFFHKLFQDTPLQLSSQQVSILTNLVNQGFRWTVWHRRMDLSALGRQLFHNGDLHKGYCLALAAEELGIGGFPLHANPLVGHKHFSYSDYTVHRTPHWMMSLKMSSSRTIGSEHVNEDNVQGYYLGDGATYYYIGDDSGYMDALPLWDWRKVPGTTAYDDTQAINFNGRSPRNKSSQVAGLNMGLYGVSAMRYEKDGIKASKAWFFTPNAVVCLGSGISSDSSLHVTTCIDQRLTAGTPKILTPTGWQTVPPGAKVHINGRAWHRQVGYFVLDSGPAVMKNEITTGSWSDNMQMYPYEVVRDTLFTLYFDHGSRPRDKRYAYMVMPHVSPEDVANYRLSQVQVMMNTPTLQVVGGKAFANRLWAVVHSRQTARLNKATITFDKPGLYQLRPTRKGYVIVQYCDFNPKKSAI